MVVKAAVLLVRLTKNHASEASLNCGDTSGLLPAGRSERTSVGRMCSGGARRSGAYQSAQAGPEQACSRRAGFRPKGLGGAPVATRKGSGKSSGCQRDQALVLHVRRLPGNRSALFSRPTDVFGVRSTPSSARRMCSGAFVSARHPVRVVRPGHH